MCAREILTQATAATSSCNSRKERMGMRRRMEKLGMKKGGGEDEKFTTKATSVFSFRRTHSLKET